ncbi:MAG: dockerin type I repeat-containing protein [Clostridia bacterium]|nr:dockerin type I repeat-containing protein [Clostridia bacterium]
MRFKKAFSLILAALMTFSPAAFGAGADAAEREIKSAIIVNAGESVAVWNTDIAQNGVDRNSVRLTATGNVSFDVIFAEETGIATAFTDCTVNNCFVRETRGYISAGADGNEGMLVWVKVFSGKVLLEITSIGADPVPEPLTAFASDDMLDRFSASVQQYAEYVLPSDSSQTFISLALRGTVGTEIMRTTDSQTGSYELFRFMDDKLWVDGYPGGKKDRTRSFAYRSTSVTDNGEITKCAALLLPVGQSERTTGMMITRNGTAFYSVPAISSPDPQRRLGWQDPDAYGFEAPDAYVSLSELFTDGDPGSILPGQAQDPAPGGPDGGAFVSDLAVCSSPDTEAYDPQHSLNLSPSPNELPQNQGTDLFQPSHQRQATQSGEIPVKFVSPVILSGHEGNGPTGDLPGLFHNPQDRLTCQSSKYKLYVVGGVAEKRQSASGDYYTVTANQPEDGMRFSGWLCNSDVLFERNSSSFTVYRDFLREDTVFTAVFEPITYAVSVSASEGGSLSADRTEAAAGETVAVRAECDPGYCLSSVSALSGNAVALTPDPADPGLMRFAMPAGNTVVSASFAKIPFAVTASADNGALTCDVQTAAVGDTVTLTPTPADSLHGLGSLSVRSGGADVPTNDNGDGTFSFTMPAGEVTARAVFVSYYCVCFENWNGEILQWCDLTTGQTPVYTGETPVCEPSVSHTFAFAGWDRPIGPVSGSEHTVTYRATYDASPRSYTVVFAGAEGQTLQSSSVVYGATPEYTGETPVRATDGSFVYSFERWEPQIAPVAGDVRCEPVFSAVPVLREGRNALSFGEYETVTFPFTPETDGYYRILSDGDAIRPTVGLTDSSGATADCVAFGYDSARDLHFELVAFLEAGETYGLTLSSYSRAGNISLYILGVDMFEVNYDQNTVHGTVGDPLCPTETFYTGRLFYPVATPDPGYGLLGMTVTDADGRRLPAQEDGGYYMPASDVTVTAVFAPAHEIVWTDPGRSVVFSANRAVFDDWSEENVMTQRAAAGAGVEYSFSWDEGGILDAFSIETESGEEVDYRGAFMYLNSIEVWFEMPDEAVIITVDVAESLDLVLDPGEGDGALLRYALKKDSSFTLPDCPFTVPAGKEFSGWSVKIGGADAVLMPPGDPFALTSDTTATATYRNVVPGDANSDGTVDSLDLTLLRQYLADPSTVIGKGADANGDGALDSLDLTLIRQYLADPSTHLGPQS